MERKLEAVFLYDGLGFPIQILNAPMMKFRGRWALNIDFNKLNNAAFAALPEKPSRLTGDEIRFIRHYMGMTLQAFGDLFSVSHAAVKKWENKRGRATAMHWSQEKDIRMRVRMHCGKPARIQSLYAKLEEPRPENGFRHEFAGRELRVGSRR